MFFIVVIEQIEQLTQSQVGFRTYRPKPITIKSPVFITFQSSYRTTNYIIIITNYLKNKHSIQERLFFME